MMFSEEKKGFNILYYAKKMENYDSLFYNLLDFGNPIWDNKIKRVKTVFNEKEAKYDIKINPNFFECLSENSKIFVLSQQALHILLNHPMRALMDGKDIELSQKAQEIVVNELLFSDFNFSYFDIDLGFNLAFVETVFSEEDIEKYNIKKRKSFNYYYNLLKKIKPENNTENIEDDSFEDSNDNSQKSGGITIEKYTHQALIQEMIENGSEKGLDVINSVCGISKKDINSVLDYSIDSVRDIAAGSSALGKEIDVDNKEVKEKPIWEKIVGSRIASLQKEKNIEQEREHFMNRPRRMATMDDDMFIPAPYNKIEKDLENDKFNIFLYIDASASCSEYVPLFYDLAKSIPRDKFEISLFSFDSEVYKLDVDNPKVYGGGGTYFHIIEESIQKEMVNNKKEKYPDLVFIVTDGDGDNVNPEISKNWFWIMPDGSDEQYISSDSEIVYIEDIAPEYNYSSFQDNPFSYDSFDFF